jgi:hypothetical protein
MATVRRVCRNVKRWRSAPMALRWTAAAKRLTSNFRWRIKMMTGPLLQRSHDAPLPGGFGEELRRTLGEPPRQASEISLTPARPRSLRVLEEGAPARLVLP